MYNNYLLDEDEYILCKSNMDTQTFNLFIDICNKYDNKGIPFPLLKIIHTCQDKGYWGKFYSNDNFKENYKSYNSYYGDLYKVLAFTIYGYGNWSNNNRINKGLKPIRFKQL